MNTKTVLLFSLLCLLLAPGPVSAQWETLIPYGGSANEIQPLYIGPGGGGNYVVLHHVFTYSTPSSDIYLSSFNGANGNVISLQNVSSINNFRWLLHGSADGAGGYVACGRALDPFDNSIKPYVIRIGSSGAVVWEKYLPLTTELLKIKPDNNNGFICVGRSNNNQLDLIQLQGNGNLVWNQSHPIGNPDYADIIQLANGSFLVAAAIRQPATYLSGQLLQFSPAGSITAQYLLKRSLYNEGFTSILPSSDGNYIVAGFSQVVSNRNEGWMVKCDPNGVILWNSLAGAWNDDIFRCAIELSNGELAATGDFGSFWNGSELYLVRADPANGAVLFEQSYPAGGTSPSRGYCLTEGPDNSVVVLGAANVQNVQNLMVANYRLTVSGKEPLRPAPALRVSPNPAAEQFSFQLEKGRLRKARLLLYDASGALVREETWNGDNHTCQRGSLKAGAYLYALEHQGKRIASGIIILQ